MDAPEGDIGPRDATVSGPIRMPFSGFVELGKLPSVSPPTPELRQCSVRDARRTPHTASSLTRVAIFMIHADGLVARPEHPGGTLVTIWKGA